MSLPLLAGMDSDETISGHFGGCRRCDTPAPILSLPLVNPAIFSHHSVEPAMFSLPFAKFCNSFYDSINSAIVCTQWRPGRGVGPLWPPNKALWRCAGEGKRSLKSINSAISSHNGKRKGTNQIPARQGNGVRCEAISRTAAIRML